MRGPGPDNPRKGKKRIGVGGKKPLFFVFFVPSW
jgi:hypothetical protein